MREKTLKINVRENRSGNQELIIQRNWQHRAHKTQDEDTKKHTNSVNTTRDLS
jgi:hypothetical protein